MWVPVHIRPALGRRELTQSLNTQSYKDALPLAYKLASEAKILFFYLDAAMSREEPLDDIDESLLRRAIEEIEADEAIEKARLKIVKIRQQAARDEKAKITKNAKIEALENENIELYRKLRKETDHAKAMGELEAYRKVIGNQLILPATQSTPPASDTQAATKKSKAPALSVIFDEFVNQYKGDGSRDGDANKKKLNAFGGLFINCVGNKKIDQLTQKDVNDFFRLLVKYPGGRGGQTPEFKNMTFLERIEDANQRNSDLIAPKTFKSSYVSSANLFFEYLALHHEDLNIHLTTKHIDYNKLGGARDAGEDKQRSLKTAEVERLLNHELMRDYLTKEKSVCKFWLAMIGLFTGARVNEICQLNPKHDIVKDIDSGVWFFNFTEETEGGEGVEKSHKNESSRRKVPIHTRLLTYGFEDYFHKIQSAGHDRVFNQWKPKDGKASYYPEEFFRGYLRDTGLRDETLKKKVLGMHSLRSTFISHLIKCLMDKGYKKHEAAKLIQPLVGHTEGTLDENGKDVGMTLSYADADILEDGESNLSDLAAIIEHLDYGVTFPTPFIKNPPLSP
jgi:integrase